MTGQYLIAPITAVTKHSMMRMESWPPLRPVPRSISRGGGLFANAVKTRGGRE